MPILVGVDVVPSRLAAENQMQRVSGEDGGRDFRELQLQSICYYLRLAFLLGTCTAPLVVQ